MVMGAFYLKGEENMFWIFLIVIVMGAFLINLGAMSVLLQLIFTVFKVALVANVYLRHPMELLGLRGIKLEMEGDTQFIVTTRVPAAYQHLSSIDCRITVLTDLAAVLDSEFGGTASLAKITILYEVKGVTMSPPMRPIPIIPICMTLPPVVIP
jgi:hypothetical protein